MSTMFHFVALLVIGLAAAQAAPIVEDFTSEVNGAPPATFSTPVGFWSIGTIDGSKPVLLEDGTQWSGSGPANALANQAKVLYGDRWAEFIDDLSETGYFPIAVYNGVPSFSDGRIALRFMVVGGDIDQDVGILFNYKPNGDFMALRSDTQGENNMLLYQWVQGQPISLKRVQNVPTAFAQWHDQELVVSGTHVEGFLDGRKWLETELDAPVSGRIGVWAKTDTVAVIDRLVVQPAE